METAAYELVFESKIEGIVPIKKFKSKRSGLTIYIAEVEGPLVHGLIDLATEARDDDGLPHTLEHLIFLGSEDYPYKGVLDLVANRCLASGTNAWTDIDSTCYTVSTAGAEGFLKFLPIYLEHILYPTLTESGFITEVHHVNGKGEDGGVVYCEMQGCVNTGERLVYDTFMKTLYPGECGYRYNTGGALKNLQESTTHQKVKDFHRAFYRPENMGIIIVGNVNVNHLFTSIKPVEDKICSRVLDDYVKPWQTEITPLTASVETRVNFPCDDEDSGLIQIGWRAPPRNDIDSMVALEVLLTYLYHTSISPLQKEFIEVAEPLCSEILEENVMLMHGYFALKFENVPVAHLSSVKTKLFEILTKLCLGEIKIDESRLTFIMQRKIRSIYSQLESEPKTIISDYLVGDFVYGNGNAGLECLINRVKILENLLNNSFNLYFWTGLLEKYFLNNPHVAVIGAPSSETKLEMAEHEKNRIEKQKERLGTAGLKAQEELIENAVKSNEIPPPPSMITDVTVPDITNINFHPISRYSNHSNIAPNENKQFPLNNIPFRIQVDDVHSKFASLRGILDTSNVPENLKLLLPLFMELLIESPILRNGEMIPHEQVMFELSRDTVEFSTSLGIDRPERFQCGHYAQMAFLYLQVDVNNYVEGITWLHDLLFSTVFTADRVKIVATKMLNDVARLKRDGYFIVKALANELGFAKGSNHRASNLMRQRAFLTALLSNISEDSNKVIKALEELKNILINFDNLTVHIAMDIAAVSKVCGDRSLIWNYKYPIDQPREKGLIWNMSNSSNTLCSPLTIQCCSSLRTSLNVTEENIKNVIIGLGSVESNFLMLEAPSINDFTNPDFPALLVFLQYMCQLEGPLWRQIRGLGLAYSYKASVDPCHGKITLMLYRSTDVVNAFKEFKKILQDHLKDKLDFSLLESARSSLMFILIREVHSLSSLTLESLKLYFNNLDTAYLKKLLKSVSVVTIADVQAAGIKYVPKLFDSSHSFLSVCCNSSKVDAIQKGFLEQSLPLQSTTLEGSFLDNIDENEKACMD